MLRLSLLRVVHPVARLPAAILPKIERNRQLVRVGIYRKGLLDFVRSHGRTSRFFIDSTNGSISIKLEGPLEASATEEARRCSSEPFLGFFDWRWGQRAILLP